MTKNAFLKKLREDVSILSDAEQQDIINEYEQHLEMKIGDGMSEEEATADFEPYDEFIAELLAAYHINPNYQHEEKSTFGTTLRRAGLFLQRSLDVLLSLNSKELGYVLSRAFMLMIVTLGIALAPRIIFGLSFSMMMPYGTRSLFAGVGNFFYGLFVFSLVCYAIYYGLSRYLLPLRAESELTDMTDHYVTPYSTPRQPVASETEPTQRATKRQSRFTRSGVSAPKEDTIGRIFMWILKAGFLFIFFLPLLLVDLFLVAATGMAIAGAFLGYPLIGVSLIGLGATLLGILLFIAVWRVTFMEA